MKTQKSNALYKMVKDKKNSLREKEIEMLVKNFKKFVEFVEVDANEIFPYTTLSKEALNVLIKQGFEGDALETIQDSEEYIQKQFEKFCISIAMEVLK